MIYLDEILYVSIAITVGVSALLEVVRSVFTQINVKYYPLVAMALGVVIAYGSTFIPELDFNLSTPGMLVAGAIAGMSASGFYDLAYKPIKEELK